MNILKYVLQEVLLFPAMKPQDEPLTKGKLVSHCSTLFYVVNFDLGDDTWFQSGWYLVMPRLHWP